MYEKARQASAHKGAKDRNGSIAPIGLALAGNRKHSVGDTRTKITRRIDGIARSSAEREADGPDHTTGEVGPKAGSESVFRDGL